MKNFITLLLLLFVFVSVYCFAKNEIKNAEMTVEAQKLNVIFDGQGYEGMNLYNISGSNFLSLRELASFCQARLEWYSVSKKVSMKLKNRSIDIFYDSRKVSFGKNKVKLKMPSVMINKEVYIPVEFLELKYFPEMLEAVVNLDVKHRILNVSSISNISAVRYYTKENNTQIVIELEEQMMHTIKKAKNSIVVAFQRGKIIKDSIVANNGAIKDISYETKGREAIFTINLAQTPKSVTVQNFKKPFKLVMDIEHTKPVDMSKPANIYIPDTVTKTDKKTIRAVEEKIIDEQKDQKTKDIKTEESVKDDNKTESVSKKQEEQKTTEQPKQAEQTEQQQQESTEDISRDIDVVSIDTRIIANDSQIYDKPVLEEEEDDSEALAKVKVVSVEDDQIIDDSYAIIDDTETFKDIMPKAKEIAQDAKVIVLDAGHGGHDPGAVGPHGTKEKDINLAIVLQLEKVFKKDRNYKVILTRKDDTFIPLVERANIANKNKADLFVSVHCNANLKRTASGFEIYFLSEKASDTEAVSTETLENSVIALEDKSDEKKTVLQNMLWSMVVNEYINESSELSSFVIAEASGRLKIPSRGIKQANFYVLRGTQMPSVLVETAYISNYTEEAKLATESFQKSVADSIYEGIKKYYARKANKK